MIEVYFKTEKFSVFEHTYPESNFKYIEKYGVGPHIAVAKSLPKNNSTLIEVIINKDSKILGGKRINMFSGRFVAAPTELVELEDMV